VSGQTTRHAPRLRWEENGSARIKAAASAVAFLLRESPATAHRIATAAYTSTERTIHLRKTIAEESVQQTRYRLRTVHAPEVERLVRFLDGRQQRGAILLTIHLGSYLLGLLRLVLSLRHRTFLFLRRAQPATSSLEVGVFAKLCALGIDFEVII